MAAADWIQISNWIVVSEGGFVDNPRDPGGATKYGITLRELRAVRGQSVTVQNVRDLDVNSAKLIMRQQYWAAIRGDTLPPGLDYCVTDAAFNSGVVQAVKWLQAALKVPVDGHFGIMTTSALSHLADANAVIDAYCDARLGMLRALKTWHWFGLGWNNRVKLVRLRAHGLYYAAQAPKGTA